MVAVGKEVNYKASRCILRCAYTNLIADASEYLHKGQLCISESLASVLKLVSMRAIHIKCISTSDSFSCKSKSFSYLAPEFVFKQKNRPSREWPIRFRPS